MSDELINGLREQREKREKDYIKVKDMIKGTRTTNLNDTDKSILMVLEFSFDILKKDQDDISILKEFLVYTIRRIEKLEKEVQLTSNNRYVSGKQVDYSKLYTS